MPSWSTDVRHLLPAADPSGPQAARPQGIWRDNRLIVEAEKLAPPFEGRYIIDMDKEIGDVFELDGKTITRDVTKFFLRRDMDGTLVSAYPISAIFTGW